MRLKNHSSNTQVIAECENVFAMLIAYKAFHLEHCREKCGANAYVSRGDGQGHIRTWEW